MRKLYVLIFILSSFTYSKAQTWNWAVDIGRYFASGEATVVKTNNAGDIFTTGTFTGNATVGDTSWYVDTSFYWNRGNYVARLTSNNQLIWAQLIGGSNTVVYDLAVDAGNHTYVLGYYAVNLVLSDTTINDGSTGDYIIAYDETGHRLWMKVFPNPSNYGNYLAVDNTGNIIYANDNSSAQVVTVRKISSTDGSSVWTQAFTSNSTAVRGVAVDSQNNIFVGGTFGGDSVYFNSNVYQQDTGYYASSYLAKLNSSGVLQSVETISGGYGIQFDLDAADNIYVAGTFSENLKVRQYSAPVDTCIENNCEMYFMVKLNTGGTASWLNLYADEHFFLEQIDVSAAGNIYLSGTFTSHSITFGAVTLTEDTARDAVFIVKFDTDGNALWGAKDEGTYITSVFSRDIAYSESGKVYLTGNYHNTNGAIWFGNDTLPTTYFYDHLMLASLTDDQVTAVSQLSSGQSNCVVYPNPNNGVFNIRFSSAGKHDITIRDCMGNVVKKLSAENISERLDISSLSKGIYMSESSGNEGIGLFKIVIE